MFGSLTAWLVATEFRGCGFINTLAETGVVTDRHRHMMRMELSRVHHARYTTEQIDAGVQPLSDRIAELEAQVDTLRATPR